jgi:hypothetical protein
MNKAFAEGESNEKVFYCVGKETFLHPTHAVERSFGAARTESKETFLHQTHANSIVDFISGYRIYQLTV